MKGSDWVSDKKEKSGAKTGERGNSNHAAADSDSFKPLKEQNHKYKRKIKTLKRSNNSEDDTYKGAPEYRRSIHKEIIKE